MLPGVAATVVSVNSVSTSSSDARGPSALSNMEGCRTVEGAAENFVVESEKLYMLGDAAI
jgi:hypothetical protein